MNNIFKPVIDYLHLDVSLVVVTTHVHSIGRSSICIVEIGLTTNNQQLKANDCYKLSLLEESLFK
jgi:hypothetical protein